MPARIIPNREFVSDKFQVAGFTVRTGVSPAWFEIAFATDPTLFNPAAKAQRNPANFYSSRAEGPLPAERGEAVYLIPRQVLARFAGQPRLYYALATYRQPNFSQPEVTQLPATARPSIQIQRSFTGNMRGLMSVPNLRGGLTRNGNGYTASNPASLEWGGDMATAGEMVAVPAPVNGNSAGVNGSSGNGQASNGSPPPPLDPVAAQSALSLDYDDGFDPALWSAPFEMDEGGDAYGIEGPIPDDTSYYSQGQSYSVSLANPDYPQANRFVAADASNYRTGSAASPRTINRIVIHITDGGPNIQGPISWFRNPAANVSAHYIVGQNGEVVQMVRHADVAWHARSANSDSIGIEHVANTRGLTPTETQYCASAALVRWLAEQYGIPMDRTHILGHAEADPNTSHTGCPNAVWNWDYFMGMVTSGTCYPISAMAHAFSNDIPLDPGAGGQSISPDALAVGDIILSTTDTFVSEQIRNTTNAAVSHAAIYVGDGMVVEAIGEGVVHHTLAEALADDSLAVAFRHPDLTETQAAMVRDFAGQQIGQSFNYWGLVRQAGFQLDRAVWCSGKSGSDYEHCVNWVGRVNLGTASNDSFFCSQLVLAAYQHAGVPLTNTPPHWSSPGDIAELRFSSRLGYVGHLKYAPSQSQGYVTAQSRSYSPISRPARTLNAPRPVDLNWPVYYTPARASISEWAAAATMVIGWRDQMSVDDTLVQASASSRTNLAQSWDLTLQNDAAYTVEELRMMLENHGPLWVASPAAKDPQAFVITGLCGDGTPDGTKIYGYRPSGQETGFNETFRQFAGRYDPRQPPNPATATHAHVQLMHARSTMGRQADTIGCNAEQNASIGQSMRVTARPLSGQSFDVNWPDVQLVPQPTTMSCWAAAAAMVIGWRDQISIDPAEVARGSGFWSAYRHGLYPSNHDDLADAWGLVKEPPQNYSVEGWRILLENNGPLWVGVAVPSGHAVVVTGIYGDGTPDGTYMRVKDPWPPDQGNEYDRKLSDFVREYENRLTTDSAGNVNIQVLHAGGYNASMAQGYRSTTALNRGTRPGARSLQVVEIASAIAGATMTRILDNQGDISWELDQLQGLKYPFNDRNRAGPTNYSSQQLTLSGPRASTVLGLDHIYADSEITFQYNGHSLGNVQIAVTNLSDAAGGGLIVKANVMDDANTYHRPSQTEQFAAIKIRFHYRFTWTWPHDDWIAMTDVTLYGDGNHDVRYRWTQN